MRQIEHSPRGQVRSRLPLADCPAVLSPGMTDNDSEPQQISWEPVLDQTGDDLEPMRLITFGIARHTGDGVPVPEAGGALIDRDIAELVALLNRAGVKTMQSCHDIGDACGGGASWVRWWPLGMRTRTTGTRG
jgi:hypothetical protein